MKTFAFLVIMITILGFTNTFDFANIDEIQSLKQNSFASSLIETISLSLNSEKQEGANDVLKMLTDLQTQLAEDQKKDDAVFSAKNAAYNSHIKKLSAAIEVLRVEIAALTARILVLTGLIAQAEKNIKSFKNRIASLEIAIVDLDLKLIEDKKYYTEKAAGLAAVNAKLILVNSKLEKMIGSSSGVGVQSHIGQTASEKRDAAYREAAQKAQKALRKKAFIQIVKSSGLPTELVQLYLQADQGALRKLMEIISKFAADCLVQKANAEQKLVEAIATHKNLMASMKNEIKLNQASLKKQEENKKKYEVEKAQKETLRREKEDRKKALEKEREINQKLQINLAAVHTKEKADRAEESRVVGILLRIVTKRLMQTQKK